MQSDSYFSVSEVAKQLAISAEAVRGLIHAGHMAAIDVASGKRRKPRWRISADDLNDFIAARTRHVRVRQPRKRLRHDDHVIEFFH